MDILTAPFMTQIMETCSNMYRLGWDERNSGNISCLLDEDEVAKYLDVDHTLRTIPLSFHACDLAGRLFLVTATGSYFKNISSQPEQNLGILRIAKDGMTAQLLWGFEGNGTFTSELPAHLMSHMTRFQIDPNHRVIMHCHPTNLLAMTYVHTLDEREFTRTLWQMCTECVMIFPDGVNVLPWMLCGTKEIGQVTAEKMETARLVVWAQHGIYAAGAHLDETFGLIETAEKAAEIYIKIAHLPRLNTITDEQLQQMVQHLGLKAREGYLF